MEEVYHGNLAGDSIELGDRDGVRDASNHLETITHGDKKDAVEAALVELGHGVDILECPTDRLCRKTTQLVVVELAPALCEANIFVNARTCENMGSCEGSDMYKTYSQRPEV